MSKQQVAAAIAGAVAMIVWSAQASAALYVDYQNDTDDQIQMLRVGPTGTIFADVRLAPSEQCGFLSINADGTPNLAFDQDGRLGLNTCPPDLRVLADGSLALLESVTSGVNPSIRVRSASGAIVSTSPELYPADGTTRRRTPQILAPLADGSYLVGGLGKNCQSCYGWLLGKINADGSIDTSFGGGAAIFDFGGTSQDLRSLHPLASGKILLTGSKVAAGPDKVLALRVNADGTVDPSFGANGKVEIDGQRSLGQSAVDSAGRLYLLKDQGVVVRILADGSLDATYISGTAQPGTEIGSMAIDSSDRLVLFGAKSGGGYVGRFDSAGNPDVTFNGTGEAIVAFARPLSIDMTAPVCVGALQSGDQPLLACSVDAETDPATDARSDVAFVRFTSAGAEDPAFAAGQPAPDSYPDAISFPSVTAPYGTASVQSEARVVTGMTDPARVEISGGEYSIGCNGTFTAVPGVIAPAQSICLRRSASMDPGGTATATVTIGGRAATFTVISSNSPADFVPDAFSFQAQSGVTPGALVISNAVTITGITGLATATVTNGSYSIGCTQTFTTAARSIANGTSICVRHVASQTPGASQSTQLTVGGVSATFTSTTTPPDTTPDAFTFAEQTGVAAGAVVTSEVVTITGINAPANISIADGEYSIGCTLTFTAAAGTISSGQAVCVRHTASASANTRVVSTLTIGGVSGTFASTTAPASNGGTNNGGGTSNGTTPTSNKGGGGSLDAWMLALLFSLMIGRRVGLAVRPDPRKALG